MSIFANLFKKQEDAYSDFNWQPLIEIDQLELLEKESQQNQIIIFKHSTRCGISNSVLKRFEQQWKDNQTIKFYYLDLLQFRFISNAIAQRYQVEHQSPQIIVIKSNKVIHHASHSSILNYK